MSNQEAFTLTWNRYLVNNEEPGVIFNKNAWCCALRGENGTRCALGALIPDEDYDKQMERWYIKELQREILPLAACDYFFLRKLQAAHDDASIPFSSDGKTIPARGEQFRQRLEPKLREVAQEFSLEVPA